LMCSAFFHDVTLTRCYFFDILRPRKTLNTSTYGGNYLWCLALWIEHSTHEPGLETVHTEAEGPSLDS
jgi:hypothetical protein